MKKSHQLIVFCAFVLSGFSGLVYESVWSHYLGLFLGHAALAQTLTLAIFMGGMAIGAWIAGKHIKKIKNAVMVYALIEVILGVWGLMFHQIFDSVLNFSFESIFPHISSPFLINFVKWSIASLLILPQAILLGSTFPLLSSGIIRRVGNSEGQMLSTLYFTNSLGAAFGAILATFLLIPNIGMPGALLVAGILNIFVAIFVYLVGKIKEPEFNPIRSKELQESQQLNVSNKLVLLVALFTGFASFVYEISWIRMLNLVLGTTLHSFEIMLSAFILGLALGGLWIKKRIDHIKNIASYLGVIQIMMGIMAILTMPLYIESFTWVSDLLKYVLKTTESGYVFYNILTAALAMLIMMPAAFFAGMTLPLLTMILMKNGENENAIGKVYSFNTIGALLGVWFAIHVGMIYFGLKYMLVFASLIDFVLGVVLLFKSSSKKIHAPKWSRFSPIIYIMVLIVVVFSADFSPRTLAAGTYRYARDTVPIESEMVFYKDGKSASISVIKQKVQGEDGFVIATNGKPDASVVMSDSKYTSDQPTMILMGAIPLLINPEVSEVANIGFGSGITTNTLLSSDKIETLDTIEIEPYMIEGAELLGVHNERVFTDPRSNLVIDDAKTFFATHNKSYDLIVSEPSNPWVMGVGNLFSVEFYKNIKKYLKKDGVLVQWIQLYEISPKVIATAFNAINQEFEYISLYRSNHSDVILVASNQPIPEFQYEQFSQLPELLKVDLNRVGINNLDLIQSRNSGSNTEIKNLFSAITKTVNSDYFPTLSLDAPKDRFMKANSIPLFQYENFYLPMFEYLSLEDGFSSEVLSNPDLFHPYAKQMNDAKNVLDYLISDRKENQVVIKKEVIGLVELFNNYSYLCSSNNIENEINWLAALFSILNKVSILGSEYLQEVMEHEAVNYCLNAFQNNENKLIISSLQSFALKNYENVLIQTNTVLNQNSTLNIQFKKFLFNNSLFAIISLQKANSPTPINPRTYIENHRNLWLEHSLWLISQIKDK